MLRGQRYRLAQIRRIVLAALEHLHVAGDARAMEVYCNGSGQGLAVVISWEHTLPPLERAALGQYVLGKITAVTGLSYDHLNVFFETSQPHQLMADKHLTSRWLRERIRKLTTTSRKRRSSSAAGDVISGAEEGHNDSLALSGPEESSSDTDLRERLDAEQAARQILAIRRKLRSRRISVQDAWETTAQSSQNSVQNMGDRIIDGFLTVHADLCVEPSQHA